MFVVFVGGVARGFSGMGGLGPMVIFRQRPRADQEVLHVFFGMQILTLVCVRRGFYVFVCMRGVYVLTWFSQAAA